MVCCTTLWWDCAGKGRGWKTAAIIYCWQQQRVRGRTAQLSDISSGATCVADLDSWALALTKEASGNSRGPPSNCKHVHCDNYFFKNKKVDKTQLKVLPFCGWQSVSRMPYSQTQPECVVNVLNKSQANLFNYSSLVRSKLNINTADNWLSCPKSKTVSQVTNTGKHVHSDHYVLQNIHTTEHTLQRDISTLLFWFHAAAKAQFLSLLVKAVHVVPQILGPIHFGPLWIKILFRYPHCILKSKKKHICFTVILCRRNICTFSLFFRPTCKIVHLYFGPP